MSSVSNSYRREAASRSTAALALLLVSLACLTVSSTTFAAIQAPGDTISVVTLSANFGADNPNAPPNLTLPGAPDGDYLTLDLASGTILVVPSYGGLSKPVEVRQSNTPGLVALNAFPAPAPGPAEMVTVRWRSVAKDDEAFILMSFAIRATNGATLASVEYLHQGALSYNGQLLPVTQPNRVAQQFTIGVDFLTRTTSLSIDGAPVAGFQSVPFAQQGDDVARLSCFGEGGHPQIVYVDDLSMVALCRTDRAPTVEAPTVVDGEEGGLMLFDVSASDPDGDALGGLSADLSALPSGHGATFTPEPGNASGSFRWPMLRGQAGSYVVVFTAANALSGSAETRINVAFAGTTVTGELVWTPQPGAEGTYTVTFSATNNLNETGSAVTTIIVTSPLSAIAPVSAPTSDGRNSILAPEAPMKAPIVSASGTVSMEVGKKSTVSATATETTLLQARSIERVLASGSIVKATSGIVDFVADLSDLPTGHDAVFLVDQEPIMAAPSAFTVDPGAALSFTVSASDPDGDPLFGMSADLSALPAGHTADFTPNGSFTSGTFSWSPRPEDAGTFGIEFTSFNALVGKATTTVTVRAVSVRLFQAGSKKIRLSSNKPFGCLNLEPVNAAFALTAVDLTTIRMVSTGTGSVSEIAANTTKMAVIGDRDNNGIEDMPVCFRADDLRALFSSLRGANSVPVIVRGRLVSGVDFHGSTTIDIVAGNGSLQTVLSPNPLNPSGSLSFITKTPGAVRVSLFDLNGRFIRTIWETQAASPGAHDVMVDARGADGRTLSSGVYFFRIESRDGIDTGRFTILK